MADDPDAIVARARALIGTRFRFQGRDAAGLDCVGLVAAAYREDRVPADYAWHSRDIARWTRLLDGLLARHDGGPGPGDVLMFQMGPAHLHLGLWSGVGLIHAHAGLRRIVETPGLPDWPILGQWRRRKEGLWQR